MGGILVQTGKYKEGDEMKMNQEPTAICSDFVAAVNFILDYNSKLKRVGTSPDPPPSTHKGGKGGGGGPERALIGTVVHFRIAE